MTTIATAQSQKEFEILPEGQYTAICTQIIDLWTQEGEWKGKKTLKHKIRISWETPEETRVFTEEKGEQPFMISNNYTLSLGDNSTLLPILESWRGKAFTDEEKIGFDIKNLLGVPCLMQVAHKKSEKNGKVYVEIQSIMKLPKGMETPKANNPLVYFDIDEWNQETFENLSNYVKELINKSEEVKEKNKLPEFEEDISSVFTREDF